MPHHISVLNNKTCNTNLSPEKMLIEATKQGRIYMVNYLLESKRVDINERDKDGRTPLVNACLLADKMASTRRKLTRLLLSKSADVNLADNSGRNALMWACYSAKIDVVKILFGRSLMDLDFTCVDCEGNTALHYVSAAGHYTLTSMLVEAMKRFGISLDTRNSDGMTPLLASTRNGKEMCARVLLENGASPDIVDPQSLMNVKELAESGNLVSLVEQITIRNPRTQSRCAFPRQPDDDDMRSAMHVSGRESATSIAQAKSPVTRSKYLVLKSSKKMQTPLLEKRKEKETKVESGKSKKNTPAKLLETEAQNPFLTQPADVSEVPSPSASECNSVPPLLRGTKSAQPVINSKSVDNPYNLRSLKQVLSLYGEQQSATFRKGFVTPVMSTEDFQECLDSMKPKPQFCYSRRSSHARRCSSTSSIGLSPLLQHRRRSVLLKEYKMRTNSDPSAQSYRRRSISRDRGNTCSSNAERLRDKPFLRNLSDPLMDLRQPVKKSNLRRHSLMVPNQAHSERVKNR